MNDQTNQSKNYYRWVYLLLAFGILISGPRFSGAFAAALGIDLISPNNGWAWIEVMSGWALALFDAIAFAFVASRFKRIQLLKDDEDMSLIQRIIPANAIYWVMLLFGQIFLLFTIPTISTVHLATQVFQTPNGPSIRVPDILTWTNLWENHLTWIWLFVTSAASSLFVFLIGLVIDDFGVLKNVTKAKTYKVYDAYMAIRATGTDLVEPAELARQAGVSPKDAADFLDTLTPAIAVKPIGERLDILKERMNNKHDNSI